VCPSARRAGARLLHLRLPSQPVALAYAPPCFSAAALVAALANGLVLLVDTSRGRALAVAQARPAKPRGADVATIIVPIPGSARPRVVFAAPGRSALFSLDLADAVATLAASDAGALPPLQPGAKAVFPAAAVKVRTDYKHPVQAAAAHPRAPLVYVGYADGAVRGYDVSGGSGTALRCASRGDRCDSAAAGGSGTSAAPRGAAPAVVALCIAPHSAPGGFAHLLVAADASGRIAAWEASPNSGALTPLASMPAAPPGASATTVRGLFALPAATGAGAGAVLARCVSQNGADALLAFAASSGSGGGARGALVRAPHGAPDAAVDAILAAAARGQNGALASAAAVHGHLCDAAALPACGRLALVLSGGGDGGSCIALLRASPSVSAAVTAPCMLAAPLHLPLRHFYPDVDGLLSSSDALDARERAAGGAPSPRRAFDIQPRAFFCTGGAVAVLDVAGGEASRFEEPVLEGGAAASLARIVRSDAARCALLFSRPADGDAPAAFALLHDAADGSATPSLSAFRPGRDGVFLGDGDSYFVILEPCGAALTVYASAAALLPPPHTRAELPPPRAHRLFGGGGGACALAARHGDELRRLRLRAVLDASASVARTRPGLRLQPDEAVLQVAWQHLPGSYGVVCAVLTDARVLIADAALRPLAAHAPSLHPPRSLLWVGPALLFTTRTAVTQLTWDGRTHSVATVDAGDAAVAISVASSTAAVPEEHAAGDVPVDVTDSAASACTPGAADAPVLLAALNDRLLLLWPGRGTPTELRLRARPVGMLQPLALGLLSLRDRMLPTLRVRTALAAAAASSDVARVSPQLLSALAAAAPGLALALARAPGAWLPPAKAAQAALAAGDVASAIGMMRAPAPSAVASGAVLSTPQDADATDALTACAVEALRRHEPPLAWAAALLVGDAAGVIAAAASVAEAADRSAAFTTLTSLASRLSDRGLAAAAVSAMRAAAAEVAALTPVPPPTPPPPPRPWTLLPAPANGAVMTAGGAAVAWMDPRSGGGAAVAGVPLRMHGLDAVPQHRAAAPPRSFASTRARSDDDAFGTGAGAAFTSAAAVPASSSTSDYGGGSTAGGFSGAQLGRGSAASAGGASTHDSDDEDVVHAHDLQPGAHVTGHRVPHQPAHGADASSSSDDERPVRCMQPSTTTSDRAAHARSQGCSCADAAHAFPLARIFCSLHPLLLAVLAWWSTFAPRPPRLRCRPSRYHDCQALQAWRPQLTRSRDRPRSRPALGHTCVLPCRQ
jgi:hypothetical protein